MSLSIEAKYEENALRRKEQRKIKKAGDYKDLPGTLDFEVHYTNGCLTVRLRSAKLAGKRSQDPYALVYLLADNGMCYFQNGNKQTRTFDKNIEPIFNSTFLFQMSLHDITKKSLVVAIWDEDSKSHDDYMAGLTMSLKDVLFFRDKRVNINLMHQEFNGHPAEVSAEKWFGIKYIEEKIEMNAKGRADRGKIQTIEKYGKVNPGSLSIKLDYTDGCLMVHVGSAKQLAGKRSQDPYAFVYLHGQNGMSYFQVGNNRTKTHDKTVDPEFNHDFQFKMSMLDIASKSLVVAIWDEDSNSKDDYMAGIRLSMTQFQFFERRSVTVALMHQASDGHPIEVPSNKVFGITSTGWDLKTCNNKLVSFIDRARVLAEAYEMKGSLPSILKETTSLMPPDAGKLFDLEIEKLRGLVNGSRSKLMSHRITLDKLKNENRHLTEAYQNFEYSLKEKHQTLYGLEIRETELSAKCSSLDYLKEQIRVLELRISTERARINKGRNTFPDFGEDLRRSESHFHESTLNMPSVGGISSGNNKMETEMQQYYVKISTEYLLKMRAALNKARNRYQQNYKLFIGKIENDADEIMSLYDEIIKERSSKSSLRKTSLLDIERSRAYEQRINQLRADIRDVEMKIGNYEGNLGGLDSNYKTLFGQLDEDLNGLKAKLRALFIQFTEYTKTRYNQINEVSIYGQLLDYEEGRIRENRPVRKVTVSESVVRSSQVTGMSIGGNVSSSYGQGYSEIPKRKESGYSSPSRTPDGTLDRGFHLSELDHLSESYRESGFSNSTRTTVQSRSARSSTGTGYVGRTSALFDNIRDEV